MRNRFLAILVGLVIFMVAAPAQAREHRDRHHDQRPLISVRINNPFHNHYGYYRYGTPIWTGLHQWQNEMRVNFAIASREHNRSICERHLERYGWDNVAETRCRAAGMSYEDYRRISERDVTAAASPEDPQNSDRPTYSEPTQPRKREQPADMNESAHTTGEIWINMTGCPTRVNGVEIPREGLHVENPETATISVLTKRTTCRTTELKTIAPGVIGIVCR